MVVFIRDLTVVSVESQVADTSASYANEDSAALALATGYCTSDSAVDLAASAGCTLQCMDCSLRALLLNSPRCAY